MSIKYSRLLLVFISLNISSAFADKDPENGANMNEDSAFKTYDGGWQFGLGLELTELMEYDTGDFRWAIIIGKDFYRNDEVSVGAQLHLASSFIDDIADEDEASMDSTNIFATAHLNEFSALKLKLGLSYTRADTFFGRESDLGLIYGLDLALPNRVDNRVYHTLLSYEESIGGTDYRTLFINLIFFLH